MKLSRTSGTLGVVTLALIGSSLAMADDSGWYIGGNLGQSRAKIDDPRIIDNLLNAGISTTSISDDNRHFGYKLFGGYEFDKYFAIEGGYFDLGKFGFTANSVPAAGLTGKTKLNGANVDLVGTLPFTDRFAASQVTVDTAVKSFQARHDQSTKLINTSVS